MKARSHTIVSILLLFVLLLAALGVGQAPAAQAQQGATDTPAPQIEVTPGETPLPPQTGGGQSSQGTGVQAASASPAPPSLAEKQAVDSQRPEAAALGVAPDQDEFNSAFLISVTPYTDTVDTTGATTAADDPGMGCGVGTNSNTVWYSFIAPSDGKLHVDTFGSNYDTVLAAFTGGRGALTRQACNDDTGGTQQSQMEFNVYSGVTYYLEAADYYSPNGGQLQLYVGFTPIAKIDIPLDIVLIQDESGSMRDDIVQLKALAPQIWDSIGAASTAGFRMSIVGFRDYSRPGWGNTGDWVYRRLSHFTADRSQFVAGVNLLTAAGGGDDPEAQYEALDYLLTPNHPCIDSNANGSCTDSFDTPAGRQPLFRSGAQRIILLATDDAFHTPENTFGYPGPSRDTVIERLMANRVIVIGLVPGGAGRVAQVDDLALQTGGSTQNTGASGQDVADAIAEALGQIQPVSPDLSSIVASPASLLADGTSEAALTITLRDAANLPVTGKSIFLISSRGGMDFISQPSAPTDLNGQTVGYVSSLTAGFSDILAIDATDNVLITQRAGVEFLSENADLLRKMEMLNTASQKALENTATTVQNAGVLGDEMRSSMAEAQVSAAIDTFSLFMGTREGVNQIRELRAGVQLAIPGITDAGHGVIHNFVKEFPESRQLFDLTWQQAMETNNLRVMFPGPVLDAGYKYFAAKLAKKGLEEIPEAGVKALWRTIVTSDNGMADAGSWLAGDIEPLKLKLSSQYDTLSTNLPPMSPGLRDSYVNDLGKRVMVPYVLSSALSHQASLLQNVKEANESVGSKGFLSWILRFGADALATASYDGPGHIAVNGLLSSFDLYLDSRKLDQAQRAFDHAPTVLHSSVDTAAKIYTNQATAFDEVERLMTPHTVTGQIEAVRHYSEGRNYLLLYVEDLSYSEIDLHNTSLTEEGTFEILVQYGFNSRLFGLPWAYMPVLKSEVVVLQPNETRTIRIYYKEDEKGGSPDKGTFVTFDVLGSSGSGTYFVDSQFEIWDPQVKSLADDSKGQMITLDKDAVVIENPVTTYVMSSAASQTYQAQIFIANPFDQSLNATLRQTLPAGVTVLSTDGVRSGSTITWQRSIAARDIISVTFTFRYPANPGAPLTLPAATMSFLAPATGQNVSLTGNIPTFTGLTPLLVTGSTPVGTANTAANMPVTVRNLVSTAQTGSMQVNLYDDTEAQVFSQTRTISLGGMGSQVLTFNLPALPEGLYQLESIVTIRGVSYRAFGETYRVNPGPVVISGNTGAGRVTLSYTNGIPRTILSDANGDYSFTVPAYWSGAVTAAKTCYSADPPSRSYGGLRVDQTTQDYSFTLNPGCDTADIFIGNNYEGTFGIPIHGSVRQSFPSVNNGPVNISSATSTYDLLMAERVIYKVNGVNTSYSEMMALPASQAEQVFWLPWYNNVDLDTQLRIANVSSGAAAVRVFIGGAEMDGSPFLLDYGSSTRLSFAGVNEGPVKIESDVPIVAAERVIYKVRGIPTSFSEMMAYPSAQLDTSYWLPWYNNASASGLDTQLRIGNVSDSVAAVNVYIGGILRTPDPILLGPGQSTRLSFADVDDGPVNIVSNVPVVAAERVIYKVRGIPTSFSEMMARANSQLDYTYRLPWYNNTSDSGLDTQLRFANTSSTTGTWVHVYIGDVEMPGSPFYLYPGQSTRQSFAGINDGPVEIVGDVPIIAAERMIYKVNGVNTSFSEMMALPHFHLDMSYWLPWYNNASDSGLDTQLRFGIP